MHINLRSLASNSGHVPFVFDLDVRHLFQHDVDVKSVEPVHVDVQARPDSGVIQVTGTVVISAEFTCSRCLVHYGQQWSVPFQERFTRDPEQGDEEQDDLHVVDDDVVDLTPYVEQTVLLAMPYAPLCEDACKGLNPETGVNRNIHPADQPAARVDPRLAVLQQWLDQSKQS